MLETDSSKVDGSKLPCLAQWRRDYTMETILIELRRYDEKTDALHCILTQSDTWLCHNTRSCLSLRKGLHSSQPECENVLTEDGTLVTTIDDYDSDFHGVSATKHC